jgi:hypothetical protein
MCEANAGAEIRNRIATPQVPWLPFGTSSEELSQGIHDCLLVPQHSSHHLFLFVHHMWPQALVVGNAVHRLSSTKVAMTADPRRFAFRTEIKLSHPWQHAINPEASLEGLMGQPIRDTLIKMNNCWWTRLMSFIYRAAADLLHWELGFELPRQRPHQSFCHKEATLYNEHAWDPLVS